MAVSISKNTTKSKKNSKQVEQNVPIAVNENKIDQNESEQNEVNNGITVEFDKIEKISKQAEQSVSIAVNENKIDRNQSEQTFFSDEITEESNPLEIVLKIGESDPSGPIEPFDNLLDEYSTLKNDFKECLRVISKFYTLPGQPGLTFTAVSKSDQKKVHVKLFEM